MVVLVKVAFTLADLFEKYTKWRREGLVDVADPDANFSE
jgi:hypothetical protein